MPNVYFQFKDFEQNFISSSEAPRVKVQPVYAPFVSGSDYYSKRWIEKELDAESSARFYNMPPNVYTVQLWTHQLEETSTLVIQNNLTGSVTASAYYVNEFTGSGGGSWRLVPAPANTGSFGEEGWYSITDQYYYVYTGVYGVDGIWLRTPLAYF